MKEIDYSRSIKFSQPNWHRKRKLIFLGVALVLILFLIFGIYKVKTDYEAGVQQNNPAIQREKEQYDREHHFIKQISNPAIVAYRKNYQVLPSVVIAQAIVESNWGSSSLYQKANNPFGIKGQYHHKSITYDTSEYVHGQNVTVKSAFRKYPNLRAAIMDHDRALNKGFIHKDHVMSYVTDAELLQRNHYATDPHYARKLIKVIKLYHLGHYDLEALNG